MPRDIPAEDNQNANEVVIKRNAVLRDTVSKLDTKTKRQAYLDKAQQNHASWKQNLQEAQESTFVSVIQGDWGDVTAERSQKSGQIYAVLNMANANTPGGGYFHGLAAQEENMFRRTDCHFSIADEVMNEAKDTYRPEMTQLINAQNGKVYLDMVSPRVCIKGSETKDGDGYADLAEDKYFLFFELRAAADNLNMHHNQTLPFNEPSMRRKIAAQLDTLIEEGVRHVVLSAFGCGAFGNPAELVAKIYKEELLEREGKFTDVVFAVYHAGYGVNNYPIFRDILDGLDLAKTEVVEQKIEVEYLREFVTLEIACIKKRNGDESKKAQKLEIVLEWLKTFTAFSNEAQLSKAFGLVYSICCIKSGTLGFVATTSQKSFEQQFNTRIPAVILPPNKLLEIISQDDIGALLTNYNYGQSQDVYSQGNMDF